MTAMDAAALAARMREGAAKGLNLAAHRVQAVAVPRTPLEVGDLRSSLVVSTASSSSLESSVSSDLPYAVKQHEDFSLRHDDGQAKYLESAALDSQREVELLVQTAVQRAMGA